MTYYRDKSPRRSHSSNDVPTATAQLPRRECTVCDWREVWTYPYDFGGDVVILCPECGHPTRKEKP